MGAFLNFWDNLQISYMQISFTPRWREELVAVCDKGTLIFELTMGSYHVYFPDEQRWEKEVPDWAKDKWKLFYNACTNWCSINKIPITITDNAIVYEEKR